MALPYFNKSSVCILVNLFGIFYYTLSFAQDFNPNLGEQIIHCRGENADAAKAIQFDSQFNWRKENSNTYLGLRYTLDNQLAKTADEEFLLDPGIQKVASQTSWCKEEEARTLFSIKGENTEIYYECQAKKRDRGRYYGYKVVFNLQTSTGALLNYSSREISFLKKVGVKYSQKIENRVQCALNLSPTQIEKKQNLFSRTKAKVQGTLQKVLIEKPHAARPVMIRELDQKVLVKDRETDHVSDEQ